jgi:polysaccharide export outer membrane protein
MNKKHLFNVCFIALIAFLFFNLLSCSSTQKVKYFQDIADSGQLKTIAKAEYTEPKIQSDDILTIIVQTVDEKSTAPINIGNVPSSANANQVNPAAANLQVATVSGYLVDKEGYVTIPILGKVKLVNLTTSQARDTLREVSLQYFKDPNLIVRFANFRINIAGEVLKPGSYVVPNEKVSVLDALTMAGDLTIFGQRDNVLLLRENADGTKTPYRINLKSSKFMSSPYFYLHQNDFIYVEPSKAKAAATDAAQARNYTIIGSILSLIAIVLTRK